MPTHDHDRVGDTPQVSGATLSIGAFHMLYNCVRHGPQRVEMDCFDDRLLELQRESCILLARIGGVWHAYHTTHGFEIWEAECKTRAGAGEPKDP